jgi:hypothetical protein
MQAEAEAQCFGLCFVRPERNLPAKNVSKPLTELYP